MRIFISAAGTVTAQSVLKALRDDPRDHFIAVGDMDHYNATKAFADAFVRLPAASDPRFAQHCLEAVRAYRIELFVPLIVEREFLPLLPHKEEFTRLGCTLWVPDLAIVERLADKLTFAQFLSDIGLVSPWTVPYSRDLLPEKYPVVVKPRRGSGSVGMTLAHSAATLHESERNDCVVQEYVAGQEFTVDCFAAEPGRVVAVIPRERIQIKAGVASKARTHRNAAIETVAERVVARSEIAGPANVQGMLRADGSFVVFETNPRFAATMALTTAAGVNFGSLLVDLVSGIPIADWRGRQRLLTMVRYWNEVYEEEDERVWVSSSLSPPTRETPADEAPV